MAKPARPPARGLPGKPARQPKAPPSRPAEDLEGPEDDGGAGPEGQGGTPFLPCPFCPLQMKAGQESKWRGHVAAHMRHGATAEPDATVDGSPGVKSMLSDAQLLNALMAQLARSVEFMHKVQGGAVAAPDPRLEVALQEVVRAREEAARAREEVSEMRHQQQLEQIRQENARQFSELRTQFAASRNENGHESVSDVLVKALIPRVVADPLEQVQRFGSAVTEQAKAIGSFDANRLAANRDNLKVHMWEVDRLDAKERAFAEQQHRQEEAARGRSEFHDLVLLGRDALEKALAPVTSAIGDGLRERIAGGGSAPPAPAPAAAPQPSIEDRLRSMSPERRAQLRSQVAFADQVRVALDRADATPAPVVAPPAVPVVPPEEVFPYGVDLEEP